MAKKSMIERDKKREKLVQKYQKKRNHLKLAVKNKQDFSKQLELQHVLQKLPRNSSPTRLKKRCWATGRSRGYFRLFGLSRHVLREMTHECLVPGLTKSSW